ncbi:MAG: hypothetical protein J6U93_05830 [Alistipes sp.]|nr:hypothetical protein [Alistipes sp.]
MLRRARLLTIFMMLMMLCGGVSAQEIDYDYRAYKFYKDEEPLLVSLEDTVRMELPRAGYVANIAQRSEYALRALNYRNMGEWGGDGYALGNQTIDYTTARMLSQLRLYSEVDRGCGDGCLCPAIYSSKVFDANERLYRGHSLRAELSGKGYLGGLSYYLGYKPEYQGVLLRDDWSYRLATRVAGGDDLYVDGVYASIVDLSCGASWRGRRNKLNIFAMLPFSERGLRRASVDECYSLLGNRLYNPLWGIDNGKVRNSRVANVVRPEVLVSWDYRVTVSTTMHLTADLYYAFEGVSSLGWFDAPTPLPDNYHYLPSYYDYPTDAKYVTDAWLRNDLRYTQIDWAGMRLSNAIQPDGHARYVVESRRENVANGDVVLAFDTKLRGVDADYGLRIGGVNYHRYKVLDDLLGATHILNLDYFLVDDATQYNGTKNNLQSDNLVVREGDVFGYNYSLRRFSAEVFGRVDWEYGDMRFTVSGNIGSERISRRGHFEKEMFRGAGSYGRSQSVVLNPYNFTVAWSYVADNQTFGAYVRVAGESHDIDNLFFNPEYNNRIVADVETAQRRVAKLSYSVVPNTTLRFNALLYANYYNGGCNVVRYFDDLSSLYSNAIVKDLSWLSYGIDLGAEVSWNSMLSSNFRAVASSHRYSDNAQLGLYANSDNSLVANSDVMIKGCHRGSAELALYGDIVFRYGGWMATTSLSWCDGGYLSPSFTRRSERVVSFARSVEERDALMAQRDLPSATVVDLSLSKRVKVDDGSTLSVMLSVRNLLGGSWVVSGYESNRIRSVTNDYYSCVNNFADMVNYSYPRMLYLSLSLWF